MYSILRRPAMESPWTKKVPYTRARRYIRNGDMLLFRRGRRWQHHLISLGGRSMYVHTAMAAWWNRDLMCLEMVWGRGGRAVCLSSQVATYPGRWDVYGLLSVGGERVDRRLAVRAMKRLTGTQYGWKALGRVVCRHLSIVRWMVPPPQGEPPEPSEAPDSSVRGFQEHLVVPPEPMFCSQAVAWAYRVAGIDPVPNLPDRLTEPADLARSRLFRYRFTLVPD